MNLQQLSKITDKGRFLEELMRIVYGIAILVILDDKYPDILNSYVVSDYSEEESWSMHFFSKFNFNEEENDFVEMCDELLTECFTFCETEGLRATTKESLLGYYCCFLYSWNELNKTAIGLYTNFLDNLTEKMSSQNNLDSMYTILKQNKLAINILSTIDCSRSEQVENAVLDLLKQIKKLENNTELSEIFFLLSELKTNKYFSVCVDAMLYIEESPESSIDYDIFEKFLANQEDYE